MKRQTQLSFTGKGLDKPGDCFGGTLLGNANARSPRPLESKYPIHLVLRATKSGMRTPKAFAKVNKQVSATTAKFGVKVYKYANVGNHLHLLIKLPRIAIWAAFIRELTGRIAQITQNLGARDKGANFWLHRPYTRIVRSWQKAYQSAKEYVRLNILEAGGEISRRGLITLKKLRILWDDL